MYFTFESIENNLDSDYQIWIRRYTECDKYVRIEPQTILTVEAVSKMEVAKIRKILKKIHLKDEIDLFLT